MEEPTEIKGVRTSVRNGRLIGVTVGVVLAVMIAPSTGWLMRLQLYNSARSDNSAGVYGFLPVPANVASEFQVQLAQAVDDGYSYFETHPNRIGNGEVDPRVVAIKKLAKQYPNNPDVYGTAMLYALSQTVVCRRSAFYQGIRYSDPNIVAAANNLNKLNMPAITEYDADCLSGERLAPGNAYFPALHAYGLFALHRDNEAIAEVIAAGNRPYYKEYFDDEMTGRLTREKAIDGGKEFFARTAISCTVLLPHYASLREVARLAIANAMNKEASGDKVTGFKIRRAIRRLGGLMRAEDDTAIGNLVGLNIAMMSAIMQERSYSTDFGSGNTAISARDDAVRQQAAADNYVSYLNHIGQHDEADAFQSEREAGTTVQAIITAWDRKAFSVLGFYRVLALWLASWLSIVLATSVALFGIVAWAIARLPAIRTGTGVVSAPVRHGIALGLFPPFATLVAWIGVAYIVRTVPRSLYSGLSDSPLFMLFVSVIMVLVLTTAIVKFASRWNKQDRIKFAKSALITAVLISSMLMATLWLARHFQNGLLAWTFLWNLGIQEAGGFPSCGPSGDFPAEICFFAAMFLALPLLIAIAAVIGRRSRPYSVAIVRTAQKCSVPLVCALLIINALVVCVTSWEEKNAVHRLDQWTAGLGQYYADLSHRAWPGPVVDHEPR